MTSSRTTTTCSARPSSSQSTPNPDGTNWIDHIAAKDDGNEWTHVESGDLGDGGADEIALLDEDGGEVNVFRLADGFQRILGEILQQQPLSSVVFGDFFSGGIREVIISRNAKFPTVPSSITNTSPARTRN